jgi:sugar O-acyltransferase (sialic acid O-acetyltransferase NeuD family)
MASIVLFGLGKIAEVMHALLQDAGVPIAGFTVDAKHLPGDSAHGLPVVAFEEVEHAFPPSRHHMFVAIGYHDLNRVRASRCAAAKAKGFVLASHICPGAHVPRGTRIGENCVIMPGAALQPCAILGDDVFVWHNAVVGHHSAVGNHSWIAANCTISSGATIGPRCFIGVNAAVAHEVGIGEGAVIGAGAIVVADQPDGAVLVAPPTPRFRLDSERFMRITRMS